MNLRISLVLSADILAAIDRLAGPDVSRSAFIESIVRDYVEAAARRDAREIAAINRRAAALNAEMKDALLFQAADE